MNEFDLIKCYFTRPQARPDVILSIGDDAAIVVPPAQQQLVLTIDTLVAGVHFPLNTSAFDIGYKTAAVNLSDLAAMGAKPLWATLALTIPALDEAWLKEFARGLFAVLDEFEVSLIGGDTTKGPLSITLQAHGSVPIGKVALRRDAAKVGDLIYVSGTLGDAGLALQLLQDKSPLIPLFQRGKLDCDFPPFEKGGQGGFILQRLNQPSPRVALGLAVRELAHAALDISDGFAQDLQHILTASHVGAKIDLTRLPLSEAVKIACDQTTARRLALTSGDDYELCLTVPPHCQHEFEAAALKLNCPVTLVGTIIAEQVLQLIDENQQIINWQLSGYQHF